MTYEERVRAIAEEMAKGAPGFYSMPKRSQIIRVDSFLPAARIAVKQMAVLAEKIFTGAYTDESLADVFKYEGLIPNQKGEISQFTKFMRGYGGLPEQEAEGMGDNKPLYNSSEVKIAMEMARSQHQNFDRLTLRYREEIINEIMPKARVAIKCIQDEIVFAFTLFGIRYNINQYLLDRGLL